MRVHKTSTAGDFSAVYPAMRELEPGYRRFYTGNKDRPWPDLGTVEKRGETLPGSAVRLKPLGQLLPAEFGGGESQGGETGIFLACNHLQPNDFEKCKRDSPALCVNVRSKGIIFFALCKCGNEMT